MECINLVSDDCTESYALCAIGTKPRLTRPMGAGRMHTEIVQNLVIHYRVLCYLACLRVKFPEGTVPSAVHFYVYLFNYEFYTGV